MGGINKQLVSRSEMGGFSISWGGGGVYQKVKSLVGFVLSEIVMAILFVFFTPLGLILLLIYAAMTGQI